MGRELTESWHSNLVWHFLVQQVQYIMTAAIALTFVKSARLISHCDICQFCQLCQMQQIRPVQHSSFSPKAVTPWAQIQPITLPPTVLTVAYPINNPSRQISVVFKIMIHFQSWWTKMKIDLCSPLGFDGRTEFVDNEVTLSSKGWGRTACKLHCDESSRPITRCSSVGLYSASDPPNWSRKMSLWDKLKSTRTKCKFVLEKLSMDCLICKHQIKETKSAYRVQVSHIEPIGISCI